MSFTTIVGKLKWYDPRSGKTFEVPWPEINGKINLEDTDKHFLNQWLAVCGYIIPPVEFVPNPGYSYDDWIIEPGEIDENPGTNINTCKPGYTNVQGQCFPPVVNNMTDNSFDMGLDSILDPAWGDSFNIPISPINSSIATDFTPLTPGTMLSNTSMVVPALPDSPIPYGGTSSLVTASSGGIPIIPDISSVNPFDTSYHIGGGQIPGYVADMDATYSYTWGDISTIPPQPIPSAVPSNVPSDAAPMDTSYSFVGLDLPTSGANIDVSGITYGWGDITMGTNTSTPLPNYTPTYTPTTPNLTPPSNSTPGPGDNAFSTGTQTGPPYMNADGTINTSFGRCKPWTCQERCEYGAMMKEKCRGCRSSYRRRYTRRRRYYPKRRTYRKKSKKCSC